LIQRLVSILVLIVCFDNSYAHHVAWTGKSTWYVPPTVHDSQNPAKEATQVAQGISTIMSVVAGTSTTQIAQSTRSNFIFQMLSCNNADNSTYNPTWIDNPTTLAIGNDKLNTHLGTLVSDWVVIGTVTLIWKGATVYYGQEKTRYPGGLIIPVLFLLPHTTASSMTLIFQGNLYERFIGGLSMATQAIGTGVVAVILLPKYFHAQWNKECGNWEDSDATKYTAGYGMLFSDYQGYQGFIVAEAIESIGVGFLKACQNTGADCKTLITISAINAAVYAGSLLLLHPHRKTSDKIFYTTIAGIQAAALTTQAIIVWIGSQETQNLVKSVTEPVVMATEWALLLKSCYDVFMQAKLLYYEHFIKNKPDIKLGVDRLNQNTDQPIQINVYSHKQSGHQISAPVLVDFGSDIDSFDLDLPSQDKDNPRPFSVRVAPTVDNIDLSIFEKFSQNNDGSEPSSVRIKSVVDGIGLSTFEKFQQDDIDSEPSGVYVKHTPAFEQIPPNNCVSNKFFADQDIEVPGFSENTNKLLYLDDIETETIQQFFDDKDI
jgi:hypothetical protein